MAHLGHILDSHTVALWRADEPSGDLLDVSGNSYNLQSSGTYPAAVTGLIGGAHNANNAGAFHHIFTTPALLAMWSGEWTFETWIKLNFNDASIHASFSVAADGGYFPLLFGVFTSAAYSGFYAAGGDPGGISSPFPAISGWWVHIAYRRRQTSPGVHVRELFQNGVLVTSDADAVITNPTTSVDICVGGYNFTGNYWCGYVDDTRLSNIARSDDEIATSFTRGLLGVGTPNAPTLTFSAPAPTSSILAADSVHFTITPAAGTSLDKTVIIARMPGVGLDEVVYNGTFITSGYSAGSSISGTVDTALVFVIARTGGWPANLTITVVSASTTGGSIDVDNSWTVSDAGGLPTADAPVVFYNSPTPGTISPGEWLDFSVTPPNHASPLNQVILAAHYPTDGRTELVYDGAAFTADYVGSNSSVFGDNVNGLNFNAIRNTDWPENVDFTVYATTIGGGLLVDSNTWLVPGGTGFPSSGAITVSSVSSSANQVVLHFAGSLPVLTGDSLLAPNWTIAGSYPITISNVTVVGSTIVLTTSEQTTGTSYTLRIPQGISSTAGLLYVGALSQSFTGVGVAPTILISQSIDARTIAVIFSEAVLEADALNISNYSVNHGLTLVSATKFSPSVYHLTTSAQTAGLVYTITITGIHDLVGNLI